MTFQAVCEEALVKVIPPLVVTDSILTSINVPETEYGTYSAGETYADKAFVILDHVIYQNNSGSDQFGVYPPDNPLVWTHSGATNAWRMFDSKKSTVTQQVGTIEFEITPSAVSNSLALFGLSGATVMVTMTDPVAGLVYSNEVSLHSSAGVVGLYSWLYRDHGKKEVVILTDLPPYRNATTKVVIDAGTATAACGMVSMGKAKDIGTLQYGFSLSIDDFSTIEQSDDGSLTVKKGNYVDETDIDVKLDRSKFDTVKRFLTNYRGGTAAAYICGTTHETMAIYGYYKSFSQTVPHEGYAEVTLTIRSII